MTLQTKITTNAKINTHVWINLDKKLWRKFMGGINCCVDLRDKIYLGIKIPSTVDLDDVLNAEILEYDFT